MPIPGLRVPHGPNGRGRTRWTNMHVENRPELIQATTGIRDKIRLSTACLIQV